MYVEMWIIELNSQTNDMRSEYKTLSYVLISLLLNQLKVTLSTKKVIIIIS